MSTIGFRVLKHHKYQSFSRLSSTSTFANMSSKEPKPKAKSSGKRYACSHLSRLIQALTPSPIVKIWVGRSFDPHHMTHITINHNKNILHILLYTLAGPYLLVPVPVPVPVHHRSREGERERGPVLRLKRWSTFLCVFFLLFFKKYTYKYTT